MFLKLLRFRVRARVRRRARFKHRIELISNSSYSNRPLSLCPKRTVESRMYANSSDPSQPPARLASPPSGPALLNRSRLLKCCGRTRAANGFPCLLKSTDRPFSTFRMHSDRVALASAKKKVFIIQNYGLAIYYQLPGLQASQSSSFPASKLPAIDNNKLYVNIY
jgi:hypothetical protein